jgi:PAS domain S-box-containing protein
MRQAAILLLCLVLLAPVAKLCAQTPRPEKPVSVRGPIKPTFDRAAIYHWALGISAVALLGTIWIASLRRQVRRQTAKLIQMNDQLARFKQVTDTTTDLVAMAALDRTPLYLNAAGRAMVGIGQDEDITTISFDSIYTRRTLERFEREGFAHALERGHWTSEAALLHRDGREIPVAFVGLVLRSPGGDPLCISCIAHDISERLAMETQLRASLEHERELNQLKGSFVNTISHEFRTPLGIILFASGMLRRFNEHFDPEERLSQITVIDEAVARMTELVKQSLSLGRAEVATPRMQLFDPGAFIQRVIDEVGSSTSHRSPIVFETDAALPLAFCDDTMLRTVLANLLSNAVKYSPAGEPIVMKVKRAGGTAIFTVRDHGPGLREDDLPNLFTSFYRGQGTGGITGTGLGLAIVKRCVESLGGSVAARNADSGGAEFVVELPLFVPPP